MPISKPRLAEAIDRFDTAVRHHEHHVRREGDVHVLPLAILVCLPVSTWVELEAEAGLQPFEVVAVRAAHHRFATAVVGGRYERPRRNLLVLAAAGATVERD